MTITVVCDVLGKENNGTTIAAMNLIRYLKSRGHEVRVLCADQERRGEEGYYIVPNYKFPKLIDSYIKKVGVTLAKPDVDIVTSTILGSDIVHIMVPLPLGMCACKVARKMGIPITAGFHMQAENFTSHIKANNFRFVNNYVYKFIWKHMYKYVGGIHYPTRFIREIFESRIKTQTKGYVISNGVNSYVQKRDIEKPEEFKDKIVILATGRFSREKSQDTLIRAVKRSKYKDKIQLIFAGLGAKEKYYKRLSKGLPVQPIFKFYSRTEIIDVLNYCDLYVHPAEVELEGIACLEAIACGKLTIVSDSKLSATKEFAIDDTCRFKNRNPKSLAHAIDYWIEHPMEKEEYEKRYLESATVFNQEECMKRMENMMVEVIQNTKREQAESQEKDLGGFENGIDKPLKKKEIKKEEILKEEI